MYNIQKRLTFRPKVTRVKKKVYKNNLIDFDQEQKISYPTDNVARSLYKEENVDKESFSFFFSLSSFFGRDKGRETRKGEEDTKCFAFCDIFYHHYDERRQFS